MNLSLAASLLFLTHFQATPKAMPDPNLYQESLRPQFHFTARQWTTHKLNPQRHEEGWVNDLNGLIYYDGEYHLFAQRWATCWIHAVSKDLVHWTEIQPAFWEESLGSGVQSGTCVIDYDNTSGLSPDKANPPMVAFWSRFDNNSQCICYSLDHGRTWTRYAGNPHMHHPERDPKVFWYAPDKHWVMMMYGDGQYHVLTSADLLHWKDEHNPIPNSYECPDFFELPIDGNSKSKKWVLIQGNGNYSIGTFNGTKFTEEVGRFPCDIGPHFYATQSWANTETGDGRRVQTAWMAGSDFPDMPFNQQISFPCELKLKTTPAGLRVFRKPIKEIASIHGSSHAWKNKTLAAGETLMLASTGDLYHLKADVEIPEGSKLILNLRGEKVVIGSKSLESGGRSKDVQGHIQSIEILLDRGSIEAFANSGEISSTRYAVPTGSGISLTCEGQPVVIKGAHLYALKSIWPKNIPTVR